MTEFILFRHKSNGEIRSYPEHYADHPVFGDDLEVYIEDDEVYEEDKVVDESHEVPVEQRARRVATKKDDSETVTPLTLAADTKKNEEN